MIITRKSLMSGKTNTMDIAITKQQLERWSVGGELIQNVAPDLTPDEREFIMTGITSDEWEHMCNSLEEVEPFDDDLSYYPEEEPF